jgi:uncharacterized protein (TIGR02996 family)
MTTEDDFHAALDTNPDDWQTRLVFADWLQERGDPRADGYRALGLLRLRPYVAREHYPDYDGDGQFGWCIGTNEDYADREEFRGRLLPKDWFRLVSSRNRNTREACSTRYWVYFRSRRVCEDLAALAFAKLPEDSRAELLAGAPTESKSVRKKPSARKPKGKKK